MREVPVTRWGVRAVSFGCVALLIAACGACQGREGNSEREAQPTGPSNAAAGSTTTASAVPGKVRLLKRRGKISIAGRSHGPTYRVELAIDEAERSRGLMFRHAMDDDAGMLFFMPGDDDWSFYMRNTYLALDMIFIDRHWRVVGVLPNVAPLTETLRRSGQPCRYVLELNAHEARKHGIRVGTHLLLHREENGSSRQ